MPHPPRRYIHPNYTHWHTPFEFFPLELYLFYYEHYVNSQSGHQSSWLVLVVHVQPVSLCVGNVDSCHNNI